jgi:hypothetical protein
MTGMAEVDDRVERVVAASALAGACRFVIDGVRRAAKESRAVALASAIQGGTMDLEVWQRVRLTAAIAFVAMSVHVVLVLPRAPEAATLWWALPAAVLATALLAFLAAPSIQRALERRTR